MRTVRKENDRFIEKKGGGREKKMNGTESKGVGEKKKKKVDKVKWWGEMSDRFSVVKTLSLSIFLSAV